MSRPSFGRRASVALLLCAFTRLAWAQPSPAPTPSPAATYVSTPDAQPSFYLDRIEVEFDKPVPPERARALFGAANPAALPWVRALKSSQALKIETSVPERLAVRTGLLKVYTVRFPKANNLSQLEGVRKELTGAAPGPAGAPRIVRTALVPMALPPDPPLGEDPWVHGGGVDAMAPHEGCGTQVYIERTGVQGAWDCGASGKGVAIAVIDWGFVTSHVDTDGAAHTFNVCNGASAITENGRSYHGAANLGLTAARKDGKRMQGIAHGAVAWRIQAYCDADDSAAPANPWAAAIGKVIEWKGEGPVVLLLEVQTSSGRNYEGSLAVRDAVERAIAKGIVVVIAAGNGTKDAGFDDDGKEIEDTGSIVVGATASEGDSLAWFSNSGERIDVSAPGDGLLTCGKGKENKPCNRRPDGTDPPDSEAYTVRYGGTSGASAIVAGVVALMLEKNPTLQPEKVRQMLRDAGAGMPVGDGDRKGGVYLEAAKAVALADPKECKKE